MELLSILRVLATHWVLVAVGVVVTVVVGLMLAFRVSLLPPKLESRSTVAVSASARVLLDARQTPSIDLGSDVAKTVPLRAGLLADLLATEHARASIARHAGIAPHEIAVLGPAAGGPPLEVPLAMLATDAASTPREPYLLGSAADPDLPIISMRAGAPTATGATKLIEAGIATLEEIVATRESRGAGLRVERLGAPHVQVEANDDHRIMAAAGMVATFGMWLTAIVVLGGLARRRRTARDSWLVPEGARAPLR